MAQQITNNNSIPTETLNLKTNFVDSKSTNFDSIFNIANKYMDNKSALNSSTSFDSRLAVSNTTYNPIKESYTLKSSSEKNVSTKSDMNNVKTSTNNENAGNTVSTKNYADNSGLKNTHFSDKKTDTKTKISDNKTNQKTTDAKNSQTNENKVSENDTIKNNSNIGNIDNSKSQIKDKNSADDKTIREGISDLVSKYILLSNANDKASDDTSLNLNLEDFSKDDDVDIEMPNIDLKDMDLSKIDIKSEIVQSVLAAQPSTDVAVSQPVVNIDLGVDIDTDLLSVNVDKNVDISNVSTNILQNENSSKDLLSQQMLDELNVKISDVEDSSVNTSILKDNIIDSKELLIKDSLSQQDNISGTLETDNSKNIDNVSENTGIVYENI